MGLLSSRLNGLPEHLQMWLSTQLVFRSRPIDRRADPFEAYSEDEEAVQLVAEATTHYRRMLAASDERVIGDLGGAVEKAMELFSALDTTTAGALAIDAEWPLPEIAESVKSDLVGVAMVCTRIERPRWRVEQTLDRLEQQKGPERFESLQWLVWQLCELYRRETGRPVTNSAMSKDEYTHKPQSPAGRFVLAAVKALQPSEPWRREADHCVERRARVLNDFVIERAVLYAMRAYVAHHSLRSGRRGRWKRGRVTL